MPRKRPSTVSNVSAVRRSLAEISAAPSPDRANALSLDEAPFVTIGVETHARFGLCPTHTLLDNPHRVAVHSRRQIDKLSRSLAVIGQLSPIVIDDGYKILAGHARLAAAKTLSWDMVPVLQVVGLSEAQKRNFLLADNRIGADARLDHKALAEQLPELALLFEEANLNLTDTGFEVVELDELVMNFEDDAKGTNDDIDPALSGESICVQAGDHFDLGAHSLIVSDARDSAVLDALMGEERADAAFLDPPYNVRVRDISGRGRIQHPEFAFASGEMTPAEFVAFLQASLGAAARASKDGAVHFVCMDWKHVHALIEAGQTVYGGQLNLIAWVKNNAGQGGLYRSQHELIGVFRVGHERHRDNVQMGRHGRNRTNVWNYPGANGFGAGRMADLVAHPTVKPVQLVADAMRDVTRRNGLVLDSFVGSGTTILAGELVGRRVRAVEIEPRYAQIALRRWEERTGREAVHRATGLTLHELADQRATQTTCGNHSIPHDASNVCDLSDQVEAAVPHVSALQPRERFRRQP